MYIVLWQPFYNPFGVGWAVNFLCLLLDLWKGKMDDWFFSDTRLLQKYRKKIFIYIFCYGGKKCFCKNVCLKERKEGRKNLIWKRPTLVFSFLLFDQLRRSLFLLRIQSLWNLFLRRKLYPSGWIFSIFIFIFQSVRLNRGIPRHCVSRTCFPTIHLRRTKWFSTSWARSKDEPLRP